MTYEKTPIKESKGIAKKVLLNDLSRLRTPTIIWFLVKRHRVGLLATWAAVMTVLYFVPFAPDLALSLVR